MLETKTREITSLNTQVENLKTSVREKESEVNKLKKDSDDLRKLQNEVGCISCSNCHKVNTIYRTKLRRKRYRIWKTDYLNWNPNIRNVIKLLRITAKTC